MAVAAPFELYDDVRMRNTLNKPPLLELISRLSSLRVASRQSSSWPEESVKSSAGDTLKKRKSKHSHNIPPARISKLSDSSSTSTTMMFCSSNFSYYVRLIYYLIFSISNR